MQERENEETQRCSWRCARLVTALALAVVASARSEQEPFKVAFIYPGPHNDGGWSQAHEKGRLAVEKALGDEGGDDLQGERASERPGPTDRRGSVREGYDMIFGCTYGMFENGVNGQLDKKYPDVLFEQATGLQIKKNQSELLRCRRGHDLPLRHGCGCREQEGSDRLHRSVRHPGGRASHQCLHPRRTGHASRRKGQADLDELVVLTRPKEAAAAKNLIAAGVDVLGQNVDSPTGWGGRRVEGDSLGRL